MVHGVSVLQEQAHHDGKFLLIWHIESKKAFKQLCSNKQNICLFSKTIVLLWNSPSFPTDVWLLQVS